MPISTKFLEKLKAKGSKLTYLDLGSAYPMTNDEDIKLLVKMFAENNNLSSIKKIMLNESTISDEGADLLTNFNKLETLSISMNNLTDKGAKSISKIKSLIVLDIAENDITNDGMSEIVSSLPNLKSLTLSSEAVGNKTAEAILMHPNLEEVLIFDDENVESDVLKQINKHIEKNKKQNKANKNYASEAMPRSSSEDTSKTAFFKSTSKLEEENVKYMQRKIDKIVEMAISAMRKMPYPDQQEEFKKNLIEAILKLPLLPNSPVCKG